MILITNFTNNCCSSWILVFISNYLDAIIYIVLLALMI